MCVGPSQSGKTTFVSKLLRFRENEDFFTHSLGAVHYHYGVFFDELEAWKAKEPDTFHLYEGLPTSLDHINPYDVVVLDDLMQEVGDSPLVTELFTRTVHHKPCFLVMLSQNLYHQSKDGKTRQLNTKYLVVFKNPRDRGQIGVLSRQMYPGNPKFLVNVYTDATRRPYGYLFIDLHQGTPDQYRLRTNILPGEVEPTPMVVYEAYK